MYTARRMVLCLGAIRDLFFLSGAIEALISGNYVHSGIRQHGVFVAHFDEPHRYQLLQMRWADRGQYPALGRDVAERPTQVNRLLKVKVDKSVFDVVHIFFSSWLVVRWRNRDIRP
jgi:hypothetical protein